MIGTIMQTSLKLQTVLTWEYYAYEPNMKEIWNDVTTNKSIFFSTETSR
jgi:hypothetical protein